MKRPLWIGLLLTLLVPTLVGFSSSPQRGPALTVSVEAGYDTYYRRGYWVPVRVNLTNSGDDLSGAVQVRTRDFAGLSDVSYRVPLELPRDARKQVFLYVSLDSFTRVIQVEVVDRQGGVVERLQSAVQMVQSGDLIAAVVTGSPYGAVDLQGVTIGTGMSVQARWLVDEIPPNAEALRGLDVILIHDADTGALSASQVKALSQWTLGGGHLIVTGGDAWQRTTAGLSHMLPVELHGSVLLPGLSDLGRYLRTTTDGLDEPITAAEVSPTAAARVLVAAGDVPLIVRSRYGAGYVDFLTVDPDAEPFRSWADKGVLWQTLIASVGPRPSWAYGVRDWTSAREGTLTLFRTILPDFLQLCGFLAIYILLVGPVNYYVLKRLNRRELAWFTMPGLILLFSALAYSVGFNLRGNVPTVNRLNVMRVWPGYEQAQVISLIGVQSPRRAEYDVVVERGFLLRALPEQGIGLNVPAAMTQATHHVAESILIDAGTLVSFVAEGAANAPALDVAATWFLGDRTAPRIIGRVRNLTDVPLRDAVVLVKGEARSLGTLAPGAEVDFEIRLGPQDPGPLSVRSSLQQRPTVPYNPWQFSPAVPGWCFSVRGIPLTLTDVMGGEPFACASRGVSQAQQETRRRYRLLAALATDDDLSGGRGDGVYVFAWTDEPLVAVELPGHDWRTEDTTLVIVELPVQVRAESALVEIPPSLTTWTVAGIEDPRVRGDLAPGAFEVGENEDAVFQFRPLPAMRLAQVHELDIQFEARGSLKVDLWNWHIRRWQAVQLNEDTPTTTLRQVSAFVGPENAVKVRVSSQGSMAYNRVDYIQVAYRGRLAAD